MHRERTALVASSALCRHGPTVGVNHFLHEVQSEAGTTTGLVIAAEERFERVGEFVMVESATSIANHDVGFGGLLGQ